MSEESSIISHPELDRYLPRAVRVPECPGDFVIHAFMVVAGETDPFLEFNTDQKMTHARRIIIRDPWDVCGPIWEAGAIMVPTQEGLVEMPVTAIDLYEGARIVRVLGSIEQVDRAIANEPCAAVPDANVPRSPRDKRQPDVGGD